MENPYAPPRSNVAVDPMRDERSELATRKHRLFAAILDAILLIFLAIPIAYFSGALGYALKGQAIPFSASAVSAAGGFGVYILVNGYFLAKYGQTVGKRYLKIKIVRIDGSQASFSRIILARQLPIHLLSLVPLFGNIVGIVDDLFVFRKDRRCIHDHIAGTKVIYAS